MEKGRSYNQRPTGRKKIHFTECTLKLDESEISILIDALEAASRVFKSVVAHDEFEIRESRRQNSIEDFHSLIRKFIAERKEQRSTSNDDRRIDLFRVQIKAIKKALEAYTNEIIDNKFEDSSPNERSKHKREGIIEKIRVIELKIKTGSLEIRRKNKIKRELIN
jgi:DNA-binding FrmR family transcriptional regulator